MHKFIIERTQIIPGDIDTVFRFFEDPHNLRLITPPWLSFRVRSATDDVVREGTRMRYTIRWKGMPMRWESVISHYEKNVAFADEMVLGPYKSWYHTHEFRATADGVEMNDRVVYELPLGFLGRIAHSLIIRPQLKAIFDFRAREIARILGT